MLRLCVPTTRVISTRRWAAITGFAFEDNIENSGEAMKLVFFGRNLTKLQTKNNEMGCATTEWKDKVSGGDFAQKR
jgi:hypothetical protein